MNTFQKTFTYEGDVQKAPVNIINLQFKIPVFKYTKKKEENDFIIKNIIGFESESVTEKLDLKEYKLNFPDNFIIGDNSLDLKVFKSFYLQTLKNKNLHDLIINITVSFLAENNTIIGEQSFDVIYFLKANQDQIDKNWSLEFFKRNVFLINKEFFDTLVASLESEILIPSNEDFYLLQLISSLLDNNNEFTSSKISELGDNQFPLAAVNKSYKSFPDVLKKIQEKFVGLFDFPISIPEIKTINVSGTFKIITSNDTKISKNDLANYDLILQYSNANSENSQTIEIQYDWNKSSDKLENNTIPFSFSDTDNIFLSAGVNSIKIYVKGFNGSVLWSQDYLQTASELNNVQIVVSLLKPITLTSSQESNQTDKNKKLRGKIIVLNKDCPLKDITVVIQARKKGGKIPVIVGAANTDNSGNFSMPYPYGIYNEAQAMVSLIPNDPTDIGIIHDGENNQTIADDFLYLLVKDADCAPKSKDEDCDCNSPKKASRLPDQKDLINSDEYSQDLGGSCVNLSTPNRTLSEYGYTAIVRTSDPTVANYTLIKTYKTDNQYGSSLLYKFPKFGFPSEPDPTTEAIFQLKEIGEISIRPQVSFQKPIRWQDAPDNKENLTIYQAVSVATGHILHYRSQFKADGYSLGNLLYSLALAPGQKKEIVTFDSTHTLLGTESQQVTQSESLSASITDDRSITDKLSGGITEAIVGQSSSSTSGISAGGGVGLSIGPVGVSLGVSGGTSSTNSDASQNSSRDVAQFFSEQLRQNIMQNADSYRQLNASVVTTVKENQKYSAVTEVVANHNHCHALTMLYFEVLRHFAVYQELSSVEECVFVPFLMTNFSSENIYKWRDVLAPHLLPMPSNTYLSSFGFGGVYQHPLLRAFDANDRILTKYKFVDFPKDSYDEEQINFLKGKINIRTNLLRPKTRYDRILSFPIVQKDVSFSDFIKWIADGFFGNPFVGPQPDFNNYIHVDANFASVLPKDCIRVVFFDDNFFENGLLDKELWTSYASILGYINNVYGFLDYYFNGRLISEWDEIFYNDIAPVLFDKVVETIKIDAINTDLTSNTRYKGGERIMQINLNGTTTNKRKDFPLILKLFSSSTDVNHLNDLVTLIIENISITYSTSHYNGTLFSGYSGDNLLDGTELYIPENSDEKRNPHTEDTYLVRKLIEHLNSNLEYYNKVLWYRLDPDRRYMLLDGFSIEVYNDSGVKQPGTRSLASVIKNQLISVVGNSLVFPVASGYKVSNSYITKPADDELPVKADLLDYYKPLTPIEPYRISVPSRGVFAEALQSYCNACEKIESDRLQDWNKFPNTDEPTPISPVITPTPTITDWKAAFKDFATPMINIQNAPSEPSPGAGLTGLTDLLGKSGIFKDITGLDATQQNALKTYLSNQDNAKAFAEMAKDMATQSHNTEHSDKIMDTIQSAKDKGAISQEDYSKLVKGHLEQQIDGGQSTKAELESQQPSKPSLTDAAVTAINQGKDVKAQNTSVDGSSESIEISGDQSAPNAYVISGTVPLLTQKTDMVCWATVATMMVSWKDSTQYNVEDVLRKAGNQYLVMYSNNQGLASSNKENFITSLGMIGEPPADYIINQYIQWLKTYGPLWVTTDSSQANGQFSPHARVLIGYNGDETDANTSFIFIDPASGTQVTQSFKDFVSAFEQMVTDNPANLFIQIVHFKGNASEGGVGQDRRQTINDFNPINTNTLVININELDNGLAGVTNYSGFQNNHNIKHNKNWSNHPLRNPSKINQIILHESGTDFVNDTCFVLPYTAQLAIWRDNSVRQFNDLVEMEDHASGFNDNSVGIEFANLSWVKGAPASNQHLPAKYADDNIYLKLFWGVGYNIYRIPSLDQLESLNGLVNWLTSYNNPPDNANPSFTLNWLGLISYNDVSGIWDFGAQIPDEPAKNDKRYFVITKGHFLLKPANISNVSGIMSHSNIVRNSDFITPNDHVDGAFQSLYVWLRLIKFFDTNKAFNNVINLMKNHSLNLTTINKVKRYSDDKQTTLLDDSKRPVFVVDVSDQNLI